MTTEGLILIDTSVWVSALRPKATKAIREQVAGILDEDKAATCGVVITELLSGTRSKKEYRNLAEDLGALHYLPTPESVWQTISDLGFRLRTKGLHVPTTDLLIAQIAINNNCTLLHIDSHLDLIARNSSLKAEKAKA